MNGETWAYLKASKQNNASNYVNFHQLYSCRSKKFVRINSDGSVDANGGKGDRFGKTNGFEIVNCCLLIAVVYPLFFGLIFWFL